MKRSVSAEIPCPLPPGHPCPYAGSAAISAHNRPHHSLNLIPLTLSQTSDMMGSRARFHQTGHQQVEGGGHWTGSDRPGERWHLDSCVLVLFLVPSLHVSLYIGQLLILTYFLMVPLLPYSIFLWASSWQYTRLISDNSTSPLLLLCQSGTSIVV